MGLTTSDIENMGQTTSDIENIGLTTSDIENMGLTNLHDTNKELIEKKLVELNENLDSNTKGPEDIAEDIEEDIQFRTDQLEYFNKLDTARIQHYNQYIPILENLTNPEIDRHEYQDFLRDIPEEYKYFFFDDQL